MAIHPIDLSTVYTQLDTVAKLTPASQNQNQQLASSMAIVQEGQKLQEEAEGVKQLEQSSETDSAKITDQKKSGNENPQSEKREKKSLQSDEVIEKKKKIQISDPRLGNHIDVTG